MALVQKAFSDIITFSRSSNATRIGPTGLVEYAPHNLLLRSQEFDNASWSKTRSSITANAIAAPDGTVTADKLVEDTSNNTHFCVQGVSLGGSVDSSKFVFSIFAKAGERSRLRIYDNNQNTSGDTTFNLSTGAVVTGNGTITSVGNGWYRCAIYPLKDFLTTSTVYVLLDNGSTSSYAGDGTSGIFIWGAQLSVGPYPLDYTPTTSAAVYGPRFDYDPVTLAARGLLVEEQRTNIALQSNSFQTTWGQNSGTLTFTQNVTGPDGVTNSAWTFTDTSSVNLMGLYQDVSLTNGTVYAASVFIKKTTGTQTIFPAAYVIAASGIAGVGLNTTTGETTAVTLSGYATISTTAVVSDFSTYWRLSFSFTANATGVFNFSLIPAACGTSGVLTQSLTGSAVFYGAQLEAGSFATSLIPTLASTVTRSADVASVDTLSPWFNATEGTLYVDSSSFSTLAVNYIAYISSSSSNRIALYFSSIAGRLLITTLGVAEFSGNTGTLANGLNAKLAVAYKLNDSAFASGAFIQSDSSVIIPTVNAFEIGSGGGAGFLNGHIRRIAYYPRRLTNAELQALTA